MAFGDRLKLIRKTKGLTQEQLEQSSGISQSTLSSWENGVNDPSWSQVVKLAETLGVSCQEFQDRKTAPTLTPEEVSILTHSYGLHDADLLTDEQLVKRLKIRGGAKAIPGRREAAVVKLAEVIQADADKVRTLLEAVRGHGKIWVKLLEVLVP